MTQEEKSGSPTRRPHRRGRGRGRRTPRRFPGSDYTPAQLAQRAAALPVVTYPDLPVSRQRDQIAEAIKNHQVVIVSGETGSGKTTQLPKICLELGRGIKGMIGHTQPRRIAARAVAERIAEELGGRVGRDPGDVVGYQVRFTDEVGPTTLIKLMTDGILLAEIGGDPMLSQYDTIIVDEAHERSLNIDFILGYLATLLKKRPDLKVIITSATIDSKRFADHFSKLIEAPVPVIEVEGRAYPVEVRYRPLAADIEPVSQPGEAPDRAALHDKDRSVWSPLPAESKEPTVQIGTQLHPEPDPGELGTLGYGLGEDLDLETALCEAVDELLTEPDGDILVFLPGERDIREAERTLAEHLGPQYVKDPRAPHGPNGVEIVPLYARLTAAEQHRIYEPHSLRRVVLATNIAETSLTVPQIRYVIDSGLARISRFSNKTKVQRLPIERVSQASAAQRAGRAGRTSPGIAVRLFSERDHISQPEFTEPEILRTSLASVILQMSALGLGRVADFPFLDKPSSRAVRDGVQLLVEIGALDEKDQITRLGRRLAKLPIDPRLGRMLIEADRLGCASEVLVIVSALSIQDVRERPAEFQQQADQAHARFADRTSDFITFLNMWRYLGAMSRDLSGNAFRRMCRAEFFHYLRYREWRDIVTQIRQMCRQLGIHVEPLGLPSPRLIASMREQPEPVAAAVLEYGRSGRSVSPDEVHRAILPGLLSNIGNWDEPKRNYQGPRGTRFTIWPGSALRRRTPAWVMAAELVETSRLFARTVAGIEPQWVEEFAGHLLKRSYSEPIWSRSRGSATVKERVTLYGLTLAADRQVPLTSLGDALIGRTFLGSEVELTAKTLAREMFISNALVDGDWRENYHAFVRHNQDVMAEAKDLSSRLRDPAVIPDESARYRFFDERIPAHITSAAAFNRWWKRERAENPHLLEYSLAELLPPGILRDPEGFPEKWVQGDLELPISYSFTPGHQEDGITISIPLRVLQRVRNVGFDWLVPGLLDDLCVAMVRGLPKGKRRLLAPATDTGRIVADRLRDPNAAEMEPTSPQAAGQGGSATAAGEDEVDPYSLEASFARLRKWTGQEEPEAPPARKSKPASQPAPESAPESASESPSEPPEAEPVERAQKDPREQSFSAAFSRAVRNAKGVDLSEEDVQHAQSSLPPHLRIGFRVLNKQGAIIGADDSLPALQARFRKQADNAVQDSVRGAIASASREQLEQRVAEDRAAQIADSAKRLADQRGQLSEAGLNADNISGLPQEPLPERLEHVDASGLLIRGYPGLVSQGTPAEPKAGIRVHASVDQAKREHREGLVALLLQRLKLETSRVTTRWTGVEALLLAASPYPNTEALVADAQWAAAASLVGELLVASGPESIRSEADFEAFVQDARNLFEDRVYEILGEVIRSAKAYAELQDALANNPHPALKKTRNAALSHARGLFRDGFLTSVQPAIRVNMPRYLRADARRVEVAARGSADIQADVERARELRLVQTAYEEARERIAARPYSASVSRNMEEVEFLLEELHVSLFAQMLGTAKRVSSTRLLRRIEGIERDA